MRALSLCALTTAFAACTPGAVAFAPASSGGTYAEPAPVDNRNPGQVVVDIIAEQGYKCTARETEWECYGPDSQWQFYVTYYTADDGAITIALDSWLERAFATRCESFALAVEDLQESSKGFSAACSDDTKKFQLRTLLTYDATLDVVSWVHDHEQRRATGGRNLRSIHALSRDAAQLVAQR